MEHEKLIRTKGKCCITEKPMIDSKYIHVVQTHILVNWEFPVWHDLMRLSHQSLGVAYVHDDAVKDNALIADVKYLVETRDEEIIYHLIPRCRICGCAEDDACVHPLFGNCSWMPPDMFSEAGPICSHCVETPGEATRFSKMIKPAVEEFARKNKVAKGRSFKVKH